MEYSIRYLTLAHKKSSLHRKEILQSDICGCFYCLKSYAPQEIEEWIDDDNTAICPKCGIDSVLPLMDDLSVNNVDFLEQMQTFWF